MGEHATREAEVDDLLRRGVFVDLYQVVRQAMQISYDSYSLKKVRQFFMTGAGQGAVTEGGESILEFQRFLETGDEAILAAIRDYNEEDCESTRQLRDWLLARKAEAERQFGVDDSVVDASRRAPTRRLKTTTRIARCATRLDGGRARRRLGDRSRAAAAALLSTWWTITGARPSPGGGRSSTG